jgi:hypothetical protein
MSYVSSGNMKRAGGICGPETVRGALERLLQNKTLASSARLRRFLDSTTTRTLEGSSEDLEEYTIAV